MAELNLGIGNRTTRILVEPRLLERFAETLNRSDGAPDIRTFAVITDETVGDLYAPAVLASFRDAGRDVCELRIPPGEGSKSLGRLESVFDWLAECKIGRDGLIVALGGGVISDLAGFAAATWMRGIPHAICTTTLEGAIDAAIGGKTAVNIAAAKNLVGAFHQPIFVGVDPTCFATLPARDISAGMAESIKHALITDAAFLDWHETNADAILALDTDVLTQLIVRNVEIKGHIVTQDPFERTGARIVLNFGHTIGHAIEACGRYRLRHGACVALGMVAACKLSHTLGLIDADVIVRVRTLLERYHLPTKLEQPPDFELLMASMRQDKKSRGRQLQFVLLEDVGRTAVRSDVTDDQIREAVAFLAT